MTDFAVVPVLIGPMQVLLTILPGLILAALSALVSLLHPRAVWNTLKILWRQKLQVAVVLVVIGGLVWTGSVLWRRWTPVEATTQAVAGSDWPMSRGGLERRGVVPGEHGPARGGVNWARKFAKKEAFLATPAVVGNRVYVASADLDTVKDWQNGKLYCFDADTGAKVWELGELPPPNDPERYRPTFSSPVVAGHYLVCGEGLHDTKDARIVCLDLRSEREPKVLWTYAANWHVECTPVIAGNRVFVNAGDGGIYCLKLEPGPDGQAQQVWHVGGKVNPDQFPDAETALAVYHGKVYVGLGRGGNGLVELDGATGKELRRLMFDQPVFSPPAIAHGKLYIAMGYGDFVTPWDEASDKLKEKLKRLGKTEDEIDRMASGMVPEGTVCCVDLASWKVDWRFKTKQLVLGAIAVAGDQLYCGGRDGMVYCLNRKGELLASWNSFAPIPASPAVTDQYVYIVNNAGMLYAVDRQTLEPVWQLRLGARGDRTFSYLSSPTVARGRVYVGTPFDGFVSAGEPGDKQTTPRWPSALGGGGRAGNADESAIEPFSELQWQWRHRRSPVVLRAPVAVLGEHLLVPVASGRAAGLTCFPAGAKAPKTPELLWTAALPLGVHGSPVGFGDSVWCVDGKPGDKDRQLRAFSLQSGQPLWNVPVAPAASGVLLATTDALLVQDQVYALTCFNHQGQRQWSQTVGQMKHPPAATKTMIVAASVEPGALVVLDRSTGCLLWKCSLEAPPTTSPLVRKDRIYLGTHAALEARSLLDGGALPDWQRSGGGVSAEFAFHRELLIYVNHAGELVVLHFSNGSVQARLPNARAGLPPLVSRDVVLYAAKLVRSGAELSKEMTIAAGGACAAAVQANPARQGLLRVVLRRDAADTFVLVAGVAGGPAVLARPWVAVQEEPEVWFDATDPGGLTTPLVLFNGQVYGGTGAGGLVRLGRE